MTAIWRVKVKSFVVNDNSSAESDLDEHINSWIKNHNIRNIKDIKFYVAPGFKQDDVYNVIHATVIYEEPELEK